MLSRLWNDLNLYWEFISRTINEGMKTQQEIIEKAIAESVRNWLVIEEPASPLDDLFSLYVAAKLVSEVAEDICRNLDLIGYSVEPQTNSKQ